MKDCPNRTATCKKTCEKLKEYTEWKLKVQKEKDKQFRIDDYVINSINKRNRRKK